MLPSEHCRRCREWVSQALDAAPSQFEQALVRRHLSMCEECAAFAADIRGATALLRAAEPAEPPGPIDLRLPRRVGPQLAARAGLAVAAAAAVVAALSTNGLTGGAQFGGSAAAQASAAEIPSMRLVRSHQLRPPANNPDSVRIRVIEID